MKDRKLLQVPITVKYLTEWEGFELPNGILQKRITGCGGTTLALEDKYPTIICSPRTKLLENKNSQYPNTLFVKAGITSEDVLSYVGESYLLGRVPKLLTTYDSFFKIKEIIKDTIQSWRIVVDEFLFLLGDASFKIFEELNFMNELKDCPYITYLSATPILDKYLDNLSHFKDVDYYELVWDESVLEKVKVIDIQTNNPKSYASKLIKCYKNGEYIMDGENIAKEVVFFVNSVTTIVNLIKTNKLTSDEVNIIVADNERNNSLLKKLGEDYTNGYIPKKGEPHKTFTFCSSTSFAGVDFYSTNATSVVISDCHSQNTSIDIATDLVQIAGRQRLPENPFKNTILFVYNVNPIKDSNEENFNLSIQSKLKSTIKLAKKWNEETDEDIIDQQYKMYVNSISEMRYENYMLFDRTSKQYVVNDLAMVNEKFCYDVQNSIFKNGLAVRKELEKSFSAPSQHHYVKIDEAFKLLIQDTTYEDNFRKYCELKEEGNIFADILVKKEKSFDTYYRLLGPEKCKALAYKEARLKRELFALASSERIEEEIKQIFKIGNKYSKDYIKSAISKIYKDLDVKKAAKATDLENYFDLDATTITIDGKTKSAFYLKSKTLSKINIL